ncbi:MAG: hypothetical protein M1829_000428 [Trizodia sp. TS-e1964]|nr:MAG: hypothetical protein M1829_000428 [Trizodia sp. TS-e1964]
MSGGRGTHHNAHPQWENPSRESREWRDPRDTHQSSSPTELGRMLYNTRNRGFHNERGDERWESRGNVYDRSAPSLERRASRDLNDLGNSLPGARGMQQNGLFQFPSAERPVDRSDGPNHNAQSSARPLENMHRSRLDMINKNAGALPSIPTAMITDSTRAPAETALALKPRPAASASATVLAKQLPSILSEFARQSINVSMLTLKKDFAAQRLAKKEQDYKRSQAHHQVFPALAEHQVKSKSKTQSELAEIEVQLNSSWVEHDRIIQVLAARMAAVSNSAQESKVEQLERELNDLKRNFGTAMAETQRAKQDLTNEVDYLSKSLAATKQELKLANSESISKIQLNTNSSIDKIHDRLRDIPDLRLQISKAREEFRELNSEISGSHAKISEVKKTSAELVDIAAQREDNDEKFRQAIRVMNEDLDRFSEEVSNLKIRTDTLESLPSTSLPEPTPEQSSEGHAWNPQVLAALETIRTNINQLGFTVTEVSQELERLKGDQQARDDLVADEIDKTQSMYEDSLRRLEQVDARTLELQKAQASVKPEEKQAPAALPSPPQQWEQENREEVSREIVAAKSECLNYCSTLDQSVGMVKMAVHHLETRFNSLTTEHIARTIVAQINSMYPNVATIATELVNIKHRLTYLENNLGLRPR